jgi:hypothetical protein
MADGRRYELEELINRPGTYLNPQTEVIVVVDDSQSIDSEIFNMEDFEGAEWVLVSDEVPVDEPTRDELLETFQARYGSESGRRRVPSDDEEEELGDLDGDPEALEDLEER